MVDVPAAPLLATVPGVELGSVGYWDISNATDWHPSAADMASAVAALDCKAVRRPVLKFGHSGDAGNDPSIGLVDNLRLSDDGQTLIGDFVGVPAWLAEADDEGRSVLASAYPDRSGEWEHNYVCQLGHTHPFVLHAMALLGVVRPGIGTLESLYDLYAKAPAKEEIVMATVALAAGTTIDQVRRAYYDGPGTNWALWIREMFIEPPELIVQNDDTDSLIRVPYTAGEDGAVEFGEPQPVKVEYVEARAKSEKPTVAFASKSEARPASPQIPSAAQAEETEGKEGAMPTLKEGLAQKLGIAADADDEAVMTALDEALAAKITVNNNTTEPGEPSAEQIAASIKATGQVLVDREQWTATVEAAQQGQKAYELQVQASDRTIVETAIKDGKFPPAQREHYLAMLETNRERTTTLIDQMAKGFIPMAAVGHNFSDQTEETSGDDLSWFDTAPTEPGTKREDA